MDDIVIQKCLLNTGIVHALGTLLDKSNRWTARQIQLTGAYYIVFCKMLLSVIKRAAELLGIPAEVWDLRLKTLLTLIFLHWPYINSALVQCKLSYYLTGIRSNKTSPQALWLSIKSGLMTPELRSSQQR